MPTTLDDLISGGSLMRWAPNLGPRRQSRRSLLITKEFAAWLSDLPLTLSTSRRLISPRTEIGTIAADFVAGEKMVSFIHRIDPPRAKGVMRLNTTSFRLAGWCSGSQQLVLAAGATADATHGGGTRLSDLGKMVVEARERMGIKTWETGEIYELFRAAD